ncbi:MAG: hypothetical protein LBP30_03740 [Clostridiales Family XIII bacterium]|jgi:hypothetical protein|nr:hypothetical protein [Clostridiales Family XIII bacterium]
MVVKQVVLIALGCILGIILSIFAFVAIDRFFSTDKMEYLITESLSPSGLHSIKIFGKGKPTWPYGGHAVCLEFDGNENKILTTIANDGVELTDPVIKWEEDEAIVVLKGSEQKDFVYRVSFENDDIGIVILNDLLAGE